MPCQGSGDVAQLVECSPTWMSEALGLILPALQRWRWEDQKLKGTAGYIGNQGQRGILRTETLFKKKKIKTLYLFIKPPVV